MTTKTKQPLALFLAVDATRRADGGTHRTLVHAGLVTYPLCLIFFLPFLRFGLDSCEDGSILSRPGQ